MQTSKITVAAFFLLFHVFTNEVVAEETYEFDIRDQKLSVAVFVINAGMDSAWFDPSTSRQGFFIDAHPNPESGNFIFVSWFTYGDDIVFGQRWLTAQGSFTGPSPRSMCLRPSAAVLMTHKPPAP